jgi:hypothetical protein
MTTRKSSIAYADLQKMLSAVFTLCLLNGGIGSTELDELVRRSRSAAYKRFLTLKPERAKSMDLVLLGSILHRWSRTPKYLDDEAQPFPIRASGPSPSIEALFRAERKSEAFALGLKHMRSAGLVKRTKPGLYLPRNDSILLHTLTPEMVANLALSINRLVSTLLQNTSVKGRTASRLIERNALVPDLPKRRLEEFKAFSREQGAAFVSTMNDWLENRRMSPTSSRRNTSKKAVAAGIHVFAFAEVNSK